MESSQDPNFKPPVRADESESELDLYTIPTHSRWFSWDSIHEIERFSLREFFDGSSFTRTPKIYKDYRDFIINKYREDPSRRLTFSEVRKSLVGDISYLQKVFSLLEKWGLINFDAATAAAASGDGDREDERWNVRVEEGVPHGVRVVAVPNSLKPVSLPPSVGVGESGGDLVENGFKFPPLASFSDVYGELMKQRKGIFCGNCKELCNSGHYEYIKQEGSLSICVTCFKNGIYGESKSGDDFKFIDCVLDSGDHGAVWTEAETLLLLESVLKHGDDWELVTQNVQTKSKLDCILKLIQLPFGDLMLGSAHGKARLWDSNGNVSGVKQLQFTSSKSQESVKTDDDELKVETQQIGDAENEGPPPKRVCTAPISDTSSTLMKQAAHISTMVGSHITASAAEAAVTALCYENQCTREIFDGDDDAGDELGSSLQNNEKERALEVEESEMEERPTQSENQETSLKKDVIPLTLRMRAATATALGAAAAHAKLLADQEDREIEHLVATILDTQVSYTFCRIPTQLHKRFNAIMSQSHEKVNLPSTLKSYADNCSSWSSYFI
ncbi:unnamed protein product [Ilex paraguariensis]|uniref:SWI/SNF complex subunit SWI3A n=1 Tax=Ilex paraguariensis TaxID=185542 RepID=A0ABC8UR25_9AQUA